MSVQNNIPEAGKVYEVVKPFVTLAGVTYKVGDRLELVEPTDRNPFKTKSKLCNWVVKCKYWSPEDDSSVWSNIWFMVEAGIIQACD